MKRSLLILLVFSLAVVAACNFDFTGDSTAQFCAEREKLSLRDDCFRDLGVIQQDLKICDKSQDEKKKFYCYEKVAEAKNDSEICYQIEDDYWSGLCFKHFASVEASSFLCLKITLPYLQENCFEEVAYITNDAKLCQALPQDRIMPCIVKIAKATKDFNLCSAIEEPIYRDQCVRWVALEANNSEICAEVSFKEIRTNCYSKFGLNDSTNSIVESKNGTTTIDLTKLSKPANNTD